MVLHLPVLIEVGLMPNEEPIFEQLFSDIDTDTDGFITFDEFKKNLVTNMKESVVERGSVLQSDITPKKLKDLKDIGNKIVDKLSKTISISRLKNST